MARHHAFPVLLLLLAFHIVTSASSLSSGSTLDAVVSSRTCDGIVGEATNENTETETRRRYLEEKTRYISYGALDKDIIPCTKRGASYYNCNASKKVNPYRRGCTYITHCARYLY